MDCFSQKSRAGFTLIELALAALLVGIGLLSLIVLGRNAVRVAMEAEDELRATALAEDIFATLRAASSEAYQSGGYAQCIEFWSAVTNMNAGNTSRVLEILGRDTSGDGDTGMPSKFLMHPAARDNHYIYNDALDSLETDALDTAITFPFYQWEWDAKEFVFRPAGDKLGTLWEARYQIDIELANLFWEHLPADVVKVTLNIRPRTAHLQTLTEYMTFSTFIPLEQLRQTLFSTSFETPGGNE